MNDNDKIALSLIAIASMVIWKKRKTGKIGAISDLRREKINDVYDRLTRYFSEKYGNEKHRPSRSTTSDYFTFKAGNTLITIRNGNHKGRNQRYRFVMEADLFNLAKEEGTAEEITEKIKRILDQDINIHNG